MTELHPVVRFTNSIFSGMPTPVLAVVTAVLFCVLGVNLLVPDFVPLLDEAVLAFLLYGSIKALRGSGRKGLGPATADVPVRALLKQAEANSREVEDLAKSLRAGGLPVRALEGVRVVRERVAALCEELRRIDGFLSRRENDPWQVQREVAKLERAVADAEAGGERQRLESLQVALQGVRMHADRVAQQAAERDRVVTTLRALSGQLCTLADTLRVVEERDGVPTLPEGLGAKWEPELKAVIDGLRDVAVATAEVNTFAEKPVGRGRTRGLDQDLA